MQIEKIMKEQRRGTTQVVKKKVKQVKKFVPLFNELDNMKETKDLS